MANNIGSKVHKIIYFALRFSTDDCSCKLSCSFERMNRKRKLWLLSDTQITSRGLNYIPHNVQYCHKTRNIWRIIILAKVVLDFSHEVNLEEYLEDHYIYHMCLILAMK